jgi:hypothetical protein
MFICCVHNGTVGNLACYGLNACSKTKANPLNQGKTKRHLYFYQRLRTYRTETVKPHQRERYCFARNGCGIWAEKEPLDCNRLSTLSFYFKIFFSLLRSVPHGPLVLGEKCSISEYKCILNVVTHTLFLSLPHPFLC